MKSKSTVEGIRVLLVDDEELFLETTSKALVNRGCQVITASSGEEAIEQLESRFFDVAVIDFRMPGMDGLALLRKLVAERPTLQVLILTGHATIEIAIEAMKIGAFDFLLKPLDVGNLIRSITQAAERGRLERRNIALEEELERTKGPGFIVGESQAITRVHEFIELAASSDLPVLITGESGTGKELVAQAIHSKSRRSRHQLVILDGSTLREELLASELFGHEKGAFTGAVQKKVGLFEVADRGSIFLDEIGEVSASNQAALLRVLELGTFRPVGAVREVNTDVRIITATNKDINQAVASGQFRQDLYYRLNGLSITIEPLRQRSSDIPLLAEHFLALVNRSLVNKVTLSVEALEALSSYSWPGNVRELKYVIERAVLLARKEGEIKRVHFPDGLTKLGAELSGLPPIDIIKEKPTLSEYQDAYERSYLEYLMRELKGNKSQIARVLNISRSVLYEKLSRLGIE